MRTSVFFEEINDLEARQIMESTSVQATVPTNRPDGSGNQQATANPSTIHPPDAIFAESFLARSGDTLGEQDSQAADTPFGGLGASTEFQPIVAYLEIGFQTVGQLAKIAVQPVIFLTGYSVAS